MEQPILFDPTRHSHLVSSLVHIHATCITQPTYTIATFLPPLKPDLMLTWWTDRAKEVEKGERHIIMQMATSTSGEEEVVGVVMLVMPFAQTGSFRGFIEKLLVLPEWRGKRIATMMMGKLEEVARAEGRGLLLLDTEKGSPAEVIYPRLGYLKVGEIPRYEISPFDGSLKDGVFFYKDIRPRGNDS